MSHFYGTLSGNRGTVTRQGTKTSGLTAVAASWKGAIRVQLVHNPQDDTDNFIVEQIPWQGHGCRETLAIGIVGDFHGMKFHEPRGEKK